MEVAKMTVVKRMANDWVSDAEKHWKRRCGCMATGWSLGLVVWMVARWKWRRPQDAARIAVVERDVNDRIKAREMASCFGIGGGVYSSVVLFRDIARELLEGAGVDTTEPVVAEKPVSQTLVALESRSAG